MIKRILKKYRQKRLWNKIRDSKNQSEQKYLVDNTYPLISDEELREIREAWPYMNLEKKDLTWSRIYKKEHGFSPYFIGVWQTHLLRQVFNPYEQLSSLENKALCDVYFPELPYPQAYVRRIQGIYYDKDMQVITEDKAIQILKTKHTYIIKPAFGTKQGQGVHKVTLTEEEKINDEQIRQSFSDQLSDFIAQEVLQQHPDVAALNPTSLNCCRVTTIYINGKFGYSTIIKFGRKGSNVDNWHSSFLGGVTNDGKLLEYAYDYTLNRTDHTEFGLFFGGMQLPCFVEMIQLVERSHKRLFPNCGMVGWDVVVDINNNIRVIEANVTTPGFVGEQYASGTFFEQFRDEINERMKQYYLNERNIS